MSATGAAPASQVGVSSLGVQSSTAIQQALQAPGLAQVAVPPRPADQQIVQPKKKAPAFAPARDQGGGKSPLAGAAAEHSAAGAELIDADSRAEGRARAQASLSRDLLPSSSNGLQRVYRTPTGSTVYLTNEVWNKHIRMLHIAGTPSARGKGMTTWWPVLHSATGAQTMSEGDVLDVIGDAVAKGVRGRAMRGTQSIQHQLDDRQARDFGVSEVLISVAPDGKILSAYPTRGDNVLAVKEVTTDAPAALPSDTDDADMAVAAPGSTSPTRFG